MYSQWNVCIHWLQLLLPWTSLVFFTHTSECLTFLRPLYLVWEDWTTRTRFVFFEHQILLHVLAKLRKSKFYYLYVWSKIKYQKKMLKKLIAFNYLITFINLWKKFEINKFKKKHGRYSWWFLWQILIWIFEVTFCNFTYLQDRILGFVPFIYLWLDW